MPFASSHCPDRARFVVANKAHSGNQRRLAESFLEDTQRIQELVVDDGVVHAHATFIEDAEDSLALEKFRGKLLAGAFRSMPGARWYRDRATWDMSWVTLPCRIHSLSRVRKISDP